MGDNVTITASFQGEELLAVALGKDVEEGEKVLRWALRDNSGGRKICVLHVHQPAPMIPLLGSKVPISLLEESQVKGYHETERQEMHKILDNYVHACEQVGARAVKLWIEMDSIEKGIVQLICEHGIKWLVMGAAASKSFSKKMMWPKSKKSIHVYQEAPAFCHIWFVCKGNLIHTRQSKSSGVEIAASPNIDETIDSLGSLSVAEEEIVQENSGNLSLVYHTVRSASHEIQPLAPSTLSGKASSYWSSFTSEANTEWDILSGRSASVGSRFSTCSSAELIELAMTPQVQIEGSEVELESHMYPESSGHLSYSVSSSTAEPNMNNQLYEKLDRFVDEAETSRRELLEESIKRKKAEKEAIGAIRRVNVYETMYVEELRRRIEYEEALKKCRHERDEMEVAHDNAVKEVQELKEKQAETEASISSVSEFSSSEIKEGTCNFSQALKIGVGGYGSIYKACLRYTEVAIKVLHPDSSQGPSEFQQEVNILSKLRHPNLINLIGACTEAFALIYEYLPNGSLEDRLNCKDNTPPLPWQTRIRIAAELCSALIFLHSCQPRGIVHGDLKPANILLDANFVSKLSDFGICRVLPQDSGGFTTRCCITNPKGTFPYYDPVFVLTGELTSKSDVYSFGIILLQLLTGMPAMGIVQKVQYSLRKGTLKDFLDQTAGDWPYVQAKQLANLAISCSDMERRRRPDLASEVWRVLGPMKFSCGVSSFRFDSQVSR